MTLPATNRLNATLIAGNAVDRDTGYHRNRSNAADEFHRFPTSKDNTPGSRKISKIFSAFWRKNGSPAVSRFLAADRLRFYISFMNEMPNNHELARKLAVLEERMNTHQATYETALERIERRMVERDAEAAKRDAARDAEFARRDAERDAEFARRDAEAANRNAERDAEAAKRDAEAANRNAERDAEAAKRDAKRDAEAAKQVAEAAKQVAEFAKRETRLLLAIGGMIAIAVAVLGVLIEF